MSINHISLSSYAIKSYPQAIAQINFCSDIRRDMNVNVRVEAFNLFHSLYRAKTTFVE